MKREVLVSVIIPVYNTAPCLRKCLDSIVNQTLKNIEIICVDDGSTDGSLEILREYEHKDARVKVLCQKNLYAGVARNAGMEIARGKYYVFLDSDDFFEPDLLMVQYKQCEKYGADIGLCAGDRYDQCSGQFLKSSWYLNPAFSLIQPFSRKKYGNDIFRVSNLAPWTKIFSAEFVKKNKLQFQALQRANDVFFTMTALALADKIVSKNKVLVHYRVGQTANLQSNNNKTPLAFCEALSAVKERLTQEGIFGEVKYGFANNALGQCLYNLEKLKGKDEYIELVNELRSHYLEEFGIVEANRANLNKERFSKIEELVGAREDHAYESNTKYDVPNFVKHGTAYVQNKPKVSVIIPVYNVEEYLREGLDSVVNQTLRDIQIICVNDGSTDSSLDILSEYQEKDNRFTVISKQNEGQATARNIAMEYVQAEYMIFLDSDDLWEKETVEALYNMISEKSLDILYFNMKPFIEEDCENSLSYVNNNIELSEIYDGVSFIKAMKDSGVYTTSPVRMMIRAQFLGENGISFYDGIIHEDELFVFELLMHAKRVSHLNRAFYNRRIHPNSTMTSAKTHKNVVGYFISMQEIIKYGLSIKDDEQRMAETVRAYNSLNWGARNVYSKIGEAEKKKCRFDNFFSQLLFDTLISSFNGMDLINTNNLSREQLEMQCQLYQYKASACEKELLKIKSSRSYKLMRAITFIPRKLRSAVRIYKEKGLRYVVQHILRKLHLHTK